MSLSQTLTSSSLLHWELLEENDTSFTMKPINPRLISMNGVLRADMIPEQNFNAENIATEFLFPIYGSPKKVIPITYNKNDAIFGYIYPKEDKHRYVITKVSKDHELIFIARIEIDVPPPTKTGSFFDGDMTSEMNDFLVNTGELVPYASTLQNLINNSEERVEEAIRSRNHEELLWSKEYCAKIVRKTENKKDRKHWTKLLVKVSS
jgi:hypothetical protein